MFQMQNSHRSGGKEGGRGGMPFFAPNEAETNIASSSSSLPSLGLSSAPPRLCGYQECELASFPKPQLSFPLLPCIPFTSK